MHPNPLVELLARKCDEIGKGIPHQAWDCAEAIRATTQAEIDAVAGAVKYMDQDGDVVSSEYWESAGDRVKEWFSTPLYATPAALEEEA